MPKKLLLTLITATWLSSATYAISKDVNQMTQDQLNVLSTVKNMTQSFHNGDLSGVMRSYETTAAVAFEPGAITTDTSKIEEAFQGAITLNPKFDYAGHEVIVSGDLAIHIAPWTMQAQMPDGQKIEQSGLSVAVLRKQKNGSWLMVIDNPHGQHLMGSN